MADGFRFEIDHRVASVTFNRADRFNLLTADILHELGAVAGTLASNADIDVLTLTSEGAECFSFGILNPKLRGSLSKPDVLALIRLGGAGLAQLYYTQYIDAAQRGGMEEVCSTDHFKDLIALDPAGRTQMLQWEPECFVATMKRWRANLESGVSDPMLGASEKALKAIDFPVCVIPGNDNTHSVAAGRLVHSLIPGAELCELRTDQLDVDLISMEEWAPNVVLALVVIDYLRRVSAKTPS